MKHIWALRPVLVAFSLFVSLFLCVAFYLRAPEQMVQWTVSGPQDSTKRLTPEQYSRLVDEYRKTFIQLLIGVGASGTLFFSWQRSGIERKALRVTEKTLEHTRDGKITERFAKAIEQLGALDNAGKKLLEVRFGGVYALERIAYDSLHDQAVVMEILTAYVRENAPMGHSAHTVGEPPESTALSMEVQAILTVIGRRRRATEDQQLARLDLRRVNLNTVDLHGGYLESVNLAGASLIGADLRSAHLNGADLRGAYLRGADLTGANLDGSDLSNASLQGAILMESSLNNANLAEANLQGVDLLNAQLRNANLNGANLEKAYLINSRLEGVDLIKSNLRSASLINAHLNDCDLTYAILKDADLSGAHLVKANLAGADLSRADLEKANLSQAQLHETILDRTNLKRATLRTASGLTRDQLSLAIFDADTELPGEFQALVQE